MNAGDVVITFNYDATLERVLLHLGKWSPRDGFGFELIFQEPDDDGPPVAFDRSPIRVLHLHGATGWYPSPPSSPPKRRGTSPPEALGASPMSASISLDPLFLQGLGIHCVDASLPAPPPSETQRLLHPSYLKDYTDNHVFAEIWRQAAEKLRDAEHTYIIGYSLPWADAAAFMLFLTSLRRQTVTVVNPGQCDLRRFRLFSDDLRPVKLEQWLAL